MTAEQETIKDIPLYISKSNVSTEMNKTGAWRFVRPGYDEKTAPCSNACPAGEDIARIEMLAGRGMFLAAWETILRENPFPAICGRVCFHPCERACNRGEMDDAIAVHNLERFIGDLAIRDAYALPHPFYGDESEAQKRAESGKRIAIAGSGPAGLSAAYFLTRLGHTCDIFEADSEPGGVLRWGIPWYRLPEDILKNEISRILDMGVTIYCNRPFDQTSLRETEGRYDAVFMGCGYGQPFSLKIPGGAYALDGLKFLHNIRDGGPDCVQGNVAVIGGGNTAIDVVRSLARMGSKPVLVYRRRQQDMPAFAHEVTMALEEGAELRELLSPVRIDVADGGGFELTLRKMKIADMESGTGRARVVPDGDRTETLRVDQVFTAIGADVSENWYLPPRHQDGLMTFSHTAFATRDLPTVFGGDLATPVKSATDAIASGKQAAMILDTWFHEGPEAIADRLESCRVGNGTSLSMETYLSGSRKNRNPRVVAYNAINADYFSKAGRLAPPRRSPEERVQSFSEVEGAFDHASALNEAGRCFNCGICNDCDNCRLYCPELAIYLNGSRCINLDYCKGCGICVVECPRDAMSLEEEKI